MKTRPTLPKQVILIGPMGVGKTTIGQQLAASLNYQFIDTDREIESRTGANIPLIFELEGEEGFRRRESVTLADLISRERIVLATGGGAVLKAENREAINRADLVIYLTAELDTLLQRTSKDRNRPLLQTEDPRATLKALLSAREPIYRQLADYEVHTDKRSTQDITRYIINKIEARN